MDEFDEATLEVLWDGKTHTFTQLIGNITFSHNTLRLHLDKLVDEKLVDRKKTAQETRGRPTYVYSLSSAGRRAALMHRSGVEDVVVLPFSSLRVFCRFEKGGFCKRLGKDCDAEICPQIGKWV